MANIACVDYSESYQVLTVVFMDGTHECYLNVISKKQAWEILQNLNRYDFMISRKGDRNEKSYCKTS